MKIDKYFHLYGKGKEIVFEEVPTIKDRKTGWWVWSDVVRCSNCNYKLQTTGVPMVCPNCGAKMEVE